MQMTVLGLGLARSWGGSTLKRQTSLTRCFYGMKSFGEKVTCQNVIAVILTNIKIIALGALSPAAIFAQI